MISIITPVLNGNKYIENNIAEVQKLTIPHEHIIVDGGSTDGTLSTLAKYKHLKIIHQTDKKGMYSAIHQGIISSSGRLVCYVNCDDLIIPDSFSKLYKYIMNENIDLIYSNAYLKYQGNTKKRKKYAKSFGKLLLSKGFMPFVQPSSIFRRENYDKVNGFNYEKFKLMGDRDLFQRMALLKNSRITYLPLFTCIFLVRSDSLGESNIDLYHQEKSISIGTKYRMVYYILFHFSGFLSYLKSNISFLRKRNL